MVEYKWDEKTRQFWFIEINSRYWNALNLDLLAGKDFPRWQVDAFLKGTVSEHLGPGVLGFRARYTVPADLGHLISKIRDTQVGWFDKLRSLVEFAYLGLHPAVRSDLWFPGDRVLYWRAWQSFVTRLGRG